MSMSYQSSAPRHQGPFSADRGLALPLRPSGPIAGSEDEEALPNTVRYHGIDFSDFTLGVADVTPCGRCPLVKAGHH